MDTSTMALLGVVALLAANQLLMRMAGLRGIPVVFWGLQLVNLLTGIGVLVFGLPGLQGVPAFKWLLGLYLLFRVVQNNWMRSEFLREQKKERGASASERKEAIEAALRKGES